MIIVLLDLCLAGGRSAAAADSWWWRWGGGRWRRRTRLGRVVSSLYSLHCVCLRLLEGYVGPAALLRHWDSVLSLVSWKGGDMICARHADGVCASSRSERIHRVNSAREPNVFSATRMHGQGGTHRNMVGRNRKRVGDDIAYLISVICCLTLLAVGSGCCVERMARCHTWQMQQQMRKACGMYMATRFASEADHDLPAGVWDGRMRCMPCPRRQSPLLHLVI